jgi:uncharacterized membrane protein
MNQPTNEKGSRKPRKHVNKLVTREFFEGPIPHPTILRQYEQIFSGAAERILSMAEKQSQHRQKIESDIVNSDIANERRGMNYSLFITLGLMLIGAFLIYLNHDVAGYLSLFGPSVFHAGNYIYKKLSEGRELRNKEREV